MTVTIKKPLLVNRFDILFEAYPILLGINLLLVCLLANVMDLTPALTWRYMDLFPPIIRYIGTLRKFDIPENTIAYVAIATANAAVVSYVFGALYILLLGVVLPQRAFVKSVSISPTSLRQVGSALLGFLATFYYLKTANFEDSYILYRLSIYRPLLVSLVIIHAFLYAATMALSIFVGSICEKLVVVMLKSR